MFKQQQNGSQWKSTRWMFWVKFAERFAEVRSEGIIQWTDAGPILSGFGQRRFRQPSHRLRQVPNLPARTICSGRNVAERRKASNRHRIGDFSPGFLDKGSSQLPSEEGNKSLFYRWWTGRGKFTKNHQGWHEDCVLVSRGHVGQRWMARNGLLPDLPTKCCCCGRRWSTLHHSLVRNLSLFCCCRHTCHLDRILSSIFLKSMEIHRAGIVSILNAALCSISGAKVEIPATLLSGDGTTTFRSWDRSYQVTHLLLPWLPLRWKQPEKKFAMPWTWPVQNLLWSPLKGVIFHIQWLECQTPFMWPNILIGFFKWSGPKAGSVRGSLSTARLSTNAVAYFRCSLSALAPKFTCMKKTQAPKRDLLKWCMQGPQTMLKSPFSIHWQLTMAT